MGVSSALAPWQSSVLSVYNAGGMQAYQSSSIGGYSGGGMVAYKEGGMMKGESSSIKPINSVNIPA